MDFCKQRISFDYFGEQPRLFLSDDIPSKLEHLEYMKNKSQHVLGRDEIIRNVINGLLCIMYAHIYLHIHTYRYVHIKQ